jgi:hypothetical protein
VDADPSRDELAQRGLSQLTASLYLDLTRAIDQGADPDVLREVVALWQVGHSDLTYEGLVELGTPRLCAEPECRRDVTPYDADGFPVEGEWEWYMVREEVWSASGLGPDDGVLCVGCLEGRLHRRLTPADFTDRQRERGPSPLDSERLRSRFAA